MVVEVNAEKFRNREGFEEIQALLEQLKERDLPKVTEDLINEKIGELNDFSGSQKEKDQKISTVKNDILEHLRKQHNLVPEKYYTTLWMPLGMSAFGLPIGVAIFSATKNPAFIAVGLPLGLGLGGLYGGSLNKKAEAEGRVIKYKKEQKSKNKKI